MNLSLRKQYPRLVKLHEQPMRPTWTFSHPDLESIYRNICIAFLHAALNGAPRETLRFLSRQMWAKRERAGFGDDCLMGQGPQGVVTGDPKPSVGTSK